MPMISGKAASITVPLEAGCPVVMLCTQWMPPKTAPAKHSKEPRML